MPLLPILPVRRCTPQLSQLLHPSPPQAPLGGGILQTRGPAATEAAGRHVDNMPRVEASCLKIDEGLGVVAFRAAGVSLCVTGKGPGAPAGAKKVDPVVTFVAV
jgi:hypothetical protein